LTPPPFSACIGIIIENSIIDDGSLFRMMMACF
jgi:hypothetical protein